jgi:hypothetical protein
MGFYSELQQGKMMRPFVLFCQGMPACLAILPAFTNGWGWTEGWCWIKQDGEVEILHCSDDSAKAAQNRSFCASSNVFFHVLWFS